MPVTKRESEREKEARKRVKRLRVCGDASTCYVYWVVTVAAEGGLFEGVRAAALRKPVRELLVV